MFIKVLSTGSVGNAYVLEENGKLFLLDAGIPIADIKRGINYKVADLVGCMITHCHLDHAKSEQKLKNMGIKCFAPYHDESPIQTFKADGFILKSFPLEHDGTPNCGCCIRTPSGEKVIYATDFEYIGHRFTKLRINHFLIECNHMDDIEEEGNEGKFAHTVRGHSSLSVVKEFLRVNQTDELKTVILCHLSADNANPDVMKSEVQTVVGDSVNVYIATKGLEVEL